MRNVTVFNPGQVPDFVRNRTELSAMTKALAGGADFGKRISIKGGVFRLIANGKEVAAIEDRHLDVVVVNASPKIARVFYIKAYDGSDAVSAPDCWSADGETPSEDSASKQSDKCATCKQNIAGSGTGDSRACRYQQRLAVTLANDMKGDVLQLALPATSIFGKEEGDKRPLQAYARYLAANKVDIGEVVTQMKFDMKSESPKLYFSAARWLTNEEHAKAQEQGQSVEAETAIKMSFSKKKEDAEVAPPVTETLGEKPARAKKEKAAAKEEPAAEVDEPVVRKEEKKPAAPAAKPSLAELAAGWDDED